MPELNDEIKRSQQMAAGDSLEYKLYYLQQRRKRRKKADDEIEEESESE